jgi:hypothetical protein
LWRISLKTLLNLEENCLLLQITPAAVSSTVEIQILLRTYIRPIKSEITSLTIATSNLLTTRHRIIKLN